MLRLQMLLAIIGTRQRRQPQVRSDHFCGAVTIKVGEPRAAPRAALDLDLADERQGPGVVRRAGVVWLRRPALNCIRIPLVVTPDNDGRRPFASVVERRSEAIAAPLACVGHRAHWLEISKRRARYSIASALKRYSVPRTPFIRVVLTSTRPIRCNIVITFAGIRAT